ncbi:hypothetical protein HMPREF2141_00657 [Bacteroides uniformis]|nr:hypothetical protein HMPREF2141_00657 [Bacteroides uniformis]
MKASNHSGIKPKRSNKAKSTGKRIGKSKPSKANNQLNRRVK